MGQDSAWIDPEWNQPVPENYGRLGIGLMINPEVWLSHAETALAQPWGSGDPALSVYPGALAPSQSKAH